MTPIPEKDYIDRLREADQRAVDLLAKANADRIKHNLVVVSILIALGSLLVAVGVLAVTFRH